MRAGTNEMQVIAADLIDQQPVRFNVTVTKVLPLAAERMVLVAGRQRGALDQQQYDFTQFLTYPYRAFPRVSRRAGIARR